MRAVALLVVVWGVVLIKDDLVEGPRLGPEAWLVLGLAGSTLGLAWIFCFKVLELGQKGRTLPVAKLGVAAAVLVSVWLLSELIPLPAVRGVVFVVGGALVLLL